MRLAKAENYSKNSNLVEFSGSGNGSQKLEKFNRDGMEMGSFHHVLKLTALISKYMFFFILILSINAFS